MPNYHPPQKNFFTTTRKESLTAKLTVRLEPSLMAALKEQENWQEFLRDTLKEALKAKTA